MRSTYSRAEGLAYNREAHNTQHFVGYVLLTVVIAGAALALALGWWHS